MGEKRHCDELMTCKVSAVTATEHAAAGRCVMDLDSAACSTTDLMLANVVQTRLRQQPTPEARTRSGPGHLSVVGADVRPVPCQGVRPVARQQGVAGVTARSAQRTGP